MKIKSPRQGMNQKPPDVSCTVTLEIGRRAPRPRPAHQTALRRTHRLVPRHWGPERGGPEAPLPISPESGHLRDGATPALPAWHSCPRRARASQAVAPMLVPGSHSPCVGCEGGGGGTDLFTVFIRVIEQGANLPCLHGSHPTRAGRDTRRAKGPGARPPRGPPAQAR